MCMELQTHHVVPMFLLGHDADQQLIVAAMGWIWKLSELALHLRDISKRFSSFLTDYPIQI